MFLMVEGERWDLIGTQDFFQTAEKLYKFSNGKKRIDFKVRPYIFTSEAEMRKWMVEIIKEELKKK